MDYSYGMSPEVKNKKNTFYATTPIFYPNAKLHLGSVYTATIADILVRAHRLQGEKTFFVTGADENTSKLLKVLKEETKTFEEYLSETASGSKLILQELDISYDRFVQTSNKEKHWPSVLVLWEKLVQTGDIYKSKYKGLYCNGCEAFATAKDLVEGKCPLHLKEPEIIEEENYFFKLSKYTEIIKQKIEQDELKIIPTTRKNEILSLLEKGLEDVSFSRPKHVMPYAIPVPNDPEQIIYVWCDALVSYLSGIDYDNSLAGQKVFETFWPAQVHVIGKDILRFHAAIWPAMLISAGLPLPQTILVHGFINVGGHKMSKSLGNVIEPEKLIAEYGKDFLRYYFARELSLFEDSPFTLESFKESYNANLANGLGNLTSRILTLAEKHLEKCPEMSETELVTYFSFYNNFEIKKATDYVWEKIGKLDKFIQDEEPFKVIKIDQNKGRELISQAVIRLYEIAYLLNPIMPETSELLKKLIKENKKPTTPIFARKD
jgi:methionyl-tRNA synthetase